MSDGSRDGMLNRAMAAKLENGEAVNVEAEGVMSEGDPDIYVLPTGVVDGMDYCVASSERWIWSIGRARSGPNAGTIYAATDTRFYDHPDFECLWLR